jgi:Fe-S-cluster containining protein
MKTIIPDIINCTDCGACCTPALNTDRFCDLSEEDLETFSPQFLETNAVFTSILESIMDPRMPPAALRTKPLEAKSGPCKGHSFTACAMLVGSPMHKVRCKIYEKRPQVCRQAVIPGTRGCRAIRRHVKEMCFVKTAKNGV